ncbi:fungal-specific transcription factor domain-containing protein [Mucor mucedo]|uniref:fungal-specific transcription factor domain-containing protein n=1 Tax=Mucor mucedo TaxID=29922 RepID=UPI00221E7606|nr:fungal-specific transcription factor domain-containing protein [Mucor mucedo]KAI7888893.1 fungal-specific transcription factor domain-containing protein [Mucor mucedo]
MELLLIALTNCSIAHLERNDFQYTGHSQPNSPPIQTDLAPGENEDSDFDKREQDMNKDYDCIKYTGQSSTGLRLFDNAFKDQSSIPWPGRENIVLKLVSQDELMIVRTEKSSMAKKSDILLDIGLSMRIPLSSRPEKLGSAFLKSASKPTAHQLDEMIGIYFSHLHVSFPIINKTKFLKQYDSSSTKHSILTQAVLALSFRFVSQNLPGLVEEAEHFGDDFFRKVMRLLRDSTRSRLCYVQATLLMVFFLDMDKDDIESVQWCTLGSAIRMAQDLGLHRSCANWDLPRSEIETRHRVFYALYIMDRWLGARAGKPLTILDRDFDAAIPSPFEIDEDPNEEAPVYQFFLLLIELSEILGRVLKSLYAPNAKNANLDAALDDPTIVSVLNTRLKNWKNVLDKTTDGKYLTEIDNLNLKLFYYTVVLLLHRPFSSLPTDKYSQSQSIVSESENICLNAAKQLSEVVTRRQDQTKSPGYYTIFCSPTCFIYALFQSSLVFLSKALKTKNPSDTQEFYQSIHLIKIHNDMGPAPRAIEILNMLATINGLYPGSSNQSPSVTRLANVRSEPHQTTSHNDLYVKKELSVAPRFHEPPTSSRNEIVYSRGSNQKTMTPHIENRQQYGIQYHTSQQQQHIRQPQYTNDYPTYSNAPTYSHRRSLSSDQLHSTQQACSQHHSRSISYDQLEFMTNVSPFPRVDPKLNVAINVGGMDNGCYTPQTNISHHNQSMPTFNPQPPQAYHSPYNPSNLNISSTILPPSNLNWSDWDVYLGHHTSSQQQ